MGKLIRMMPEGIIIEIESRKLLNVINIQRVMDVLSCNTDYVLNRLVDYGFRFYLRTFGLDSDEGNIDTLFFEVDVEEKIIKFNIGLTEQVGLTDHMLLYASMAAVDVYDEYKYTSNMVFMTSLVCETDRFMTTIDSLIEKQVEAFKLVDGKPDDFDTLCRFDFLATNKMLYESYTRRVMGDDAFIKTCPFLSKYVEFIMLDQLNDA
ncbi:MAG: hypothetical protein MJ245_02005 [Clostridia bacterium]|nr:hypothetical protein [Clostridia bacterium]